MLYITDSFYQVFERRLLPVYRQGAPSDPGNFSPVCVQSVSKVFESFRQVTNNLNQMQIGFRRSSTNKAHLPGATYSKVVSKILVWTRTQEAYLTAT